MLQSASVWRRVPGAPVDTFNATDEDGDVVVKDSPFRIRPAPVNGDPVCKRTVACIMQFVNACL